MKNSVKRDVARRVQFDFRPEEIALVERLIERLHASSRNEVVRRSLHLMALVVDARVLVEEDGGALRRLEIV